MKKTWRNPLPVHRFRGILRSLILGLFNGVSGLGAIVGNATLLATFYKNEAFRLPCCYFLASLAAVTDFLVALVVNPLFIALTNIASWQYRNAPAVSGEFLSCVVLNDNHAQFVRDECRPVHGSNPSTL